MSALSVLHDYRFAYLGGLLETLKLCSIAWVAGIALGTVLSLAGAHWPRLVGNPTAAIRTAVEAVPIVVLLFWLHYPLQAALGIVVDPFVTTAALLVFINSLNVFSILRRAVHGVPREFVETARVCGIPKAKIYWRIELPLALRSALGPLASAQISILQLSIFGGLISVEELFRVTQRINSVIYKPIELYTVLAGFFLVVCLPLNMLAGWTNRRIVQ